MTQEPAPPTLAGAADRIRHIRELLGFTRKEFGLRYGVSETTLYKWEKGVVGITLKNASRFLSLAQDSGIHFTVDWLLHGHGTGPQTFMPGPPLEATTLDPHLQFLKATQALKAIYPNVVSLVVDDHSMEPDYSPGDYVFGVPKPLEAIRTLLDYPFIVETQDHKRRLRRITIHQGQYHLYATNLGVKKTAPVELNVSILSAAVVIWKYTHLPPHA